MAQDIIIAGAQYPEVPAINVPKTAGGTALFVDTSEDTITAEKLLNGITAHDKNGEKVTGTLPEVVQATPIVGVDAMGKVTAYASQKAGVVAAGTKSATMQLPTQEPIEIIPSSSRQVAVEKGIFTTGFVMVAAVYAVIGVTYPAGSTCTCTSGETTLTAEDTSGKAMFIISEAGTWTIKAVSGNKSVSKAISITTAGQVEAITLIFETVLFDGADNTAVTGGWRQVQYVSGYGGIEITDTINIWGSTAYGGSSAAYQNLYITKRKIDLSNINILIARTTLTKQRAALFVTNSQAIHGWWDDTLTSADCPAYTLVTASDLTENVTVDLSNVTGSYYVGLLCDGAGQIVTPRIWLEYGGAA